MKWYHYLVGVAAGFCFGNAISHLVVGVIGQPFPSPFGDPPTIGLSSPLVNVLWGLANVVLGYVLMRVSKLSVSHSLSMIALFVGFAGVTIYSSVHFGAVLGNPSL